MSFFESKNQFRVYDVYGIVFKYYHFKISLGFIVKKCILEISTGHRMEGKLLGDEKNSSGELVFTTGMVGYTETLTDCREFPNKKIFF